jgi:hypothetical protein
MSAIIDLLKGATTIGAVTLALCASHTSASAKLRNCSTIEFNHIAISAWSKCVDEGGLIQCDSFTGKPYCCKDHGGYSTCGAMASVRVIIPPPPPKPPSVKLDVPRIDSVSQPPRPPRVDTVPSSIGPAKTPTGPKVN